jgi:hypothetical protein
MHVAPLPGSAGEHLADRLLSGRDGRRRGDFSGGRRPKRLCRHTARRSDRATRHPLVAQKRPLTSAVSSGARSETGSAAVVPDRYRFGGAGNLDQRRQQLGGAREAPFPLLERSDAPVELKPHAEIGDMTLGYQDRCADRAPLLGCRSLALRSRSGNPSRVGLYFFHDGLDFDACGRYEFADPPVQLPPPVEIFQGSQQPA